MGIGDADNGEANAAEAYDAAEEIATEAVAVFHRSLGVFNRITAGLLPGDGSFEDARKARDELWKLMEEEFKSCRDRIKWSLDEAVEAARTAREGADNAEGADIRSPLLAEAFKAYKKTTRDGEDPDNRATNAEQDVENIKGERDKLAVLYGKMQALMNTAAVLVPYA